MSSARGLSKQAQREVHAQILNAPARRLTSKLKKDIELTLYEGVLMGPVQIAFGVNLAPSDRGSCHGRVRQTLKLWKAEGARVGDNVHVHRDSN